MEKKENHETGSVEFHFTGQEFRKIKGLLAVLAAAFVVGMGASVYAVYSMNSLQAENSLYRNQLKMAEDKMESLSQKVESVEKISEELETMVNGHTENAAPAGGVGGGNTVPDREEATSEAEPKAIETPGDLLQQLARLDEIVNRELKHIISLRSELVTRSHTARTIYQAYQSEMPSMWPVTGEISSGFGWRESPGGIGSTYHEGVDICTEYNTPVRVTADGVVTKTGWVDGYGYLVEVKHADGVSTRYGHNSAIVVYEGQQVHQGDTVALAGSTGNSTGPHSHYEVRVNGTALDPMLFLR